LESFKEIMPHENYQPLVEVTRGSIVESVHFGALVVVDATGQVLASWGDPQTTTYLRSSAKPFQALPFVEMGGVEQFNLSEKELALMCASHSGTDEHVATVQAMQQKIGVAEKDLLCGIHTPSHEPTAEALLLRGEKPTPNRHNCSGKHTGMLGQAKMRQLPLEDYVNPNHPIQQNILLAFADLCSLLPEEIVVGIDGCSAPNFAVPLFNAALAFARLADPRDLAEKRGDALRRIFHAMAAYPNMVAGPGRFDTRLMEAAGGAIVSKGGAEGYQGMALASGLVEKNAPGVGIAFKVSDGDFPDRARPLVSIEILRQLGALSDVQAAQLSMYQPRPIYNFRKLEVGTIRTCFMLEKRPIYYGA
jgi:L-asparaginase II